MDLKKLRGFIGLYLVVCILLLSAPAVSFAASTEYLAKVNRFIADSRWEHGASYGDSQTPKSYTTTSSTACWSCYAYTADFVHEVWNTPSGTKDFRPAVIGEYFSTPGEITDGDVIKTSDGKNSHYYVVLQRYDNGTLWTAEGNYTDHAYISKKRYSISNPGGSKTFQYGWHMPGYDPYDLEKPVIGERSITNVTGSGYRVTAVATDNKGVYSWKVATWNDEMGLPDESWESVMQYAVVKTVTASGNQTDTLNYTVSMADFNNVTETTYHTNIYAFDGSGNQSMGIRVGNIYIDGTKPVIQSKSIDNITLEGFDVHASATDDYSGIAKWKLAVWNDEMGLADSSWAEVVAKATWITVDVSGNATRDLNYHISFADYGNAMNTNYHVNVYAFDAYDNQGMGHRAGDFYREDAKPVITQIKIVNVTRDGYDVVIHATDDYSITGWKIATWNDEMGLADGSWNEVWNKGVWIDIPAGGSSEEDLVYHIDVADFGDTRDTVYHSNGYAIDASGTWSMGMRAGNVAVLNYSGADILEIPSGTKEIGEEAFANTAAEVIMIPRRCVSVGSNAFSGAVNLRYVVVPYGLDLSGAGIGSDVKIIVVNSN